MPDEDMADPDPGLARQRTELSWTRTAISFAALGGFLLKSRPYAGIPIMALAVLIWKLGRMSCAPRAGQARSGLLLLIAVAVTAVSVAALAITLLSPESPGFRP